MGHPRRTTVQSLQRGLDVLCAVALADRPVGITELSKRFGLAKGSISRLVATLVERQFLTRDPETAKYRPSLKVWELGNGAVARLDIRDIARPVMEALCDATSETVHLTVANDDGDMVFLDKLDSTRSVRPNVEVGAVLPAYCVANGKAMLAYLPRVRADRILARKLKRYTDTTLTTRAEIQAELDEIRRLGYAVNRGEYRAEVWGVAAPIFDRSGAAVAALGISVPSQRTTDALIRDLAPRLTTSARRISHALGFREERTRADETASPPARTAESTGKASRPERVTPGAM